MNQLKSTAEIKDLNLGGKC